jgi:hypothetical protein
MKINSILQWAKARLLNGLAFLGAIPQKTLLLFVSIQLAVAALAFVVLGLIPIHREVKRISNDIIYQPGNSANSPTNASFNLAKQLIKSEHHEAMLNSNFMLSKADSISLIIDLNDSLAILSFKGVNLFKSKISTIKYNKGLEKLPLYLLDSLFSGPFVTETEFSSIEKFPIVVKKAPKDSIEAKLTNKAPELPKHSDVFWFFTFSNSFTIEILQEEEALVGSRSDFKKYQREKSKWLKQKDLNAITQTDQTGYTYQLSIEIPREDARSIYRGLPINPIVIVRY